MLALENIHVLDLSHLGPGVFCTMMLGDLGAQVTRIQALPEVSPRGTEIATSRKKEGADRRALYEAIHRNKKSLGLNLRSEAGRQIFYRLAQKADVIVEGFRPGTITRLGIDYKSMQEVNPAIVYCSLNGYGQTGPYSKLPGHDINYISLGGVLSLIGNSKGPLVILLNLIADYAGAALHGVIGILAALVARDKTGRGQYVDIAYLDATILATYSFCRRVFCFWDCNKAG